MPPKKDAGKGGKKDGKKGDTDTPECAHPSCMASFSLSIGCFSLATGCVGSSHTKFAQRSASTCTCVSMVLCTASHHKLPGLRVCSSRHDCESCSCLRVAGRDRMAAEVRNLEGEKADLSVEAAFLKSKLREAQEDADARTEEADQLRLRIAKATQARPGCSYYA